FTNIEVATFHFALRFFDGLADHAVFNGFTAFHAQPLHKCLDAVGSKNTHQVNFKGQIKTGETRVTLTAGATTQLIINTTRLVALGTNNVQTTSSHYLVLTLFALGLDLLDLFWGWILQQRHFIFPAAAEFDVRTTTGHVGSNSDHARTASLGNNLRFLFMELRVQHFVLDLFLGQE